MISPPRMLESSLGEFVMVKECWWVDGYAVVPGSLMCTGSCRQMPLQFWGGAQSPCIPYGLAWCPTHISSQRTLPALLLQTCSWMVWGLTAGHWRRYMILNPAPATYSLSLWVNHSTSLRPSFLMCEMGIIRPTIQSCENEMRQCLTLGVELWIACFPLACKPRGGKDISVPFYSPMPGTS